MVARGTGSFSNQNVATTRRRSHAPRTPPRSGGAPCRGTAASGRGGISLGIEGQTAAHGLTLLPVGHIPGHGGTGRRSPTRHHPAPHQPRVRGLANALRPPWGSRRPHSGTLTHVTNAPYGDSSWIPPWNLTPRAPRPQRQRPFQLQPPPTFGESVRIRICLSTAFGFALFAHRAWSRVSIPAIREGERPRKSHFPETLGFATTLAVLSLSAATV
jgi:hypothetical protein